MSNIQNLRNRLEQQKGQKASASMGPTFARQNVKHIKIGEENRFILPSDSLFYPSSQNIRRSAGPMIDAMANYLRTVDKVTINISGYTDSSGDKLRQLALSQHQAQNVAKALWERGVDSRLIVAIGYGASKPIATNRTAPGQTTNRRIEVSVREMHYAKINRSLY